jgi:membrane protein YdbS with pleckstrin-like domain
MPGENVVYHTRIHWAVFFPCLVVFVVTVLLFFSGNKFLAGAAGVLLVLFALPVAINALIARATSEFAVTNKRVLIKQGWLRRHSLETLLSKIETIRVEQGILGRALNYGTIVVSGTGGSKEPFRVIASPMEFRRKVQEQIAASAGQSWVSQRSTFTSPPAQ